MASTTKSPKEGTSDGWRQVDAALDRLHALARSETVSERFYSAVQAEMTGLQLPKFALWRANGGNWRLLLRTDPSDPSAEQLVAETALEQAAAARAIESNQPQVVRSGQLSPASPGATADETASCAAAPWSIAGRPSGALIAWLERGASPSAVSGQLGLLGAVAEMVSVFESRSAWQAAQQQLEVQARLAPLLESLHASLDLNEIAHRIATDGRSAVGCDRVAVLVRRGRHYRVIAVSGAEHLHRHSESVKQLESFCSAVSLTAEPFWFETAASEAGDLLPPQIQQKLAEHLDVSPAAALAVIPLRKPRQESNPEDDSPADQSPIAALVFEQFSGTLGDAARAVIAGMAPHCALALAHGSLVRRIPGRRLWLALAQPGFWSSTAFRGGLGLMLAGVLAATLVLVKSELQVRASGEIESAARREVFAPWDGVATEVHVEHGQSVQPGEPLVTIHSSELNQQLQETRGAVETARKQLAAVQSQRLQTRPGDPQARQREAALTAEEEQLQAQLKTLAEKQQTLAERRESLIVRSPLAGEVVTWNVRERLSGRPLRRGDQLLTVADPAGPWRLELRVPSRSAGRVLAAGKGDAGGHEVAWILTSQPDVAQRGVMRTLAQRLELDAAGQAHLRLTAEPQWKDSEAALAGQITPGSLVSAKISCGKSSLGEAWFYELIDTVRLWCKL